MLGEIASFGTNTRVAKRSEVHLAAESGSFPIVNHRSIASIATPLETFAPPSLPPFVFSVSFHVWPFLCRRLWHYFVDPPTVGLIQNPPETLFPFTEVLTCHKMPLDFIAREETHRNDRMQYNIFVFILSERVV